MTRLDVRNEVAAVVRKALDSAPIHDIHTHLFAPEFGELNLWGIDELLTYHYLLAEFFRVAGEGYAPERFYELPKARSAELVWEHLFVRRSPISEAARGVVTCLSRLGLDPMERDLAGYREFFANTTAEDHLNRVLELSGVKTITMTNEPFIDVEPLWTEDAEFDPRFLPVLRLDRILVGWNAAAPELARCGYDVHPDFTGRTLVEVSRFLNDRVARMKPIYMAVSLPPEFFYDPAKCGTSRLIEQSVMPVAAEHDLPLALMIGVSRGYNPRLREAGDAAGRTNLRGLRNLCAAFPKNRFLCTVLSMENQHGLAVLARKFANLHIFGCWWFVNTPSQIEQITRMRIELLGHSFTPQHSDARVLEQLIYKWEHSKAVLERVLTDKYADLFHAGWRLDPDQIKREVADLLGGAAMRFIHGKPL